ncbi:MAG: hypothetical protein M1352_03185 [Patescibacteria group bacterium]|nr:hypothetical protein [Patescibacteria group bacterium]
MESREHLWHYSILVLVVLVGLFGVAVFKQNPSARFFSIFFSVVGYVLWGAWHHYIEHRFSWVVLSEYLLVALVVLASASLILFPF